MMCCGNISLITRVALILVLKEAAKVGELVGRMKQRSEGLCGEGSRGRRVYVRGEGGGSRGRAIGVQWRRQHRSDDRCGGGGRGRRFGGEEGAEAGRPVGGRQQRSDDRWEGGSKGRQAAGEEAAEVGRSV
jgi:hypothetical protein